MALRMLPLLAVGLLGCAGDKEDCSGPAVEWVDGECVPAADDSASPDDSGAEALASPGCGAPAAHAAGGVNVSIDAGADGDGERRFHLSLPEDYDPEVPHALIVGYPGTNWVGEQIRPYLRLEQQAGGGAEIYVYPDPLWRDFPSWGNLGGWVLGPHAGPAQGMQDLVFTEALLDYMEANYCVDTERVFVTGHSWGGDMAMVAACFLGERFTASVPVAANRPYWFEDGSQWVSCSGDTAVRVMFGVADDHFTSQSYPGEYGDECRDFWVQERGCSSDPPADLGYGEEGECVAYADCSAQTEYCLYGADAGHQVPDYYARATMELFRSF